MRSGLKPSSSRTTRGSGRTYHHDRVIPGQQLAHGGHEPGDHAVGGGQPCLRHDRDTHPPSIVAIPVEVAETTRLPADYPWVRGSVSVARGSISAARAKAAVVVGLAAGEASGPGRGVHRPQP